MNLTSRRLGLIAQAMAAAALLGGCATPDVVGRAQEASLAQGPTEALAVLGEWIRDHPRDAKARAAWIAMRQRAIIQLSERADDAVRQGREDEGAAAYRSILSIDPDHAYARTRLETLERADKARQWMADARQQLEQADPDGAARLVRRVRAIDPEHPGARELEARILEIQKPASARDGPLSAALRKPVTLELRDAPLRTVFDALARAAGVNFVFDKDIKTDLKATIVVREVPVREALNLLLIAHQLEQRILSDSAVMVFPATAAKQREYQAQLLKSYYLSNADPRVVAASVRQLIKTRDLAIDEKLNLLLVRDTPEAIRIIDRLVAMHDMPEPEVMLEVDVIEVKRTRLQELGIRFPEQLTLTPLPSGTSLTLSDVTRATSATTGAVISPLTINARKEISVGDILASPRIRTRNRERARILIGERVPNVTTTSTATGFVAESIQYLDVGLKLEVEPVISLDNEVTIRIQLEVSSIVSQITTRAGSTAYRIGTRNAATVLRLRNGENQVLAGLLNDEERTSGNRMPGLGEIPVLGRLFGSQLDQADKSEIVLSITPRLVRQIQRPDLVHTEIDAGSESGLRNRSDVLGGALPLPDPMPGGMPAELPIAPRSPSTPLPSSPGMGVPFGPPGGAGSNFGAPTGIPQGSPNPGTMFSR